MSLKITMPLYSYQCKKCLEKFDLLVGMNQDKQDLKCPKCSSRDIEKQFASFAISGGSSGGHSCGSCSSGNCSSCH
ncbi:MAG: zinc ribbon domain-containing protein [Candidatus Omnitrophota bacterium]